MADDFLPWNVFIGSYFDRATRIIPKNTMNGKINAATMVPYPVGASYNTVLIDCLLAQFDGISFNFVQNPSMITLILALIIACSKRIFNNPLWLSAKINFEIFGPLKWLAKNNQVYLPCRTPAVGLFCGSQSWDIPRCRELTKLKEYNPVKFPFSPNCIYTICGKTYMG